MEEFKKLVKCMENSVVVAQILPKNNDELDMKFSVELGVAVALGKPIIGLVRPGTKISDKFSSIVDRFVEITENPSDEEKEIIKNAIQDAIKELVPQIFKQ